MTRPAFSKILSTSVAALVLACVPNPASARRGEDSHGGRGSHGGGSQGGTSHGGGGFRGGGHSSFRGGGHSYSGSRGGARVSSAQMGGGRATSGRMSGGTYARPGGFSPRPSGSFARNSALGGGSFGSSVASRNFGRFGASQAAARGFRSTVGEWHTFGNSTARAMPASARTSGNAMGGGWHSFGNLSHGGGAELSRGYGSHVRSDGQWHSFGNSRNASFGTNVSVFSFSGVSRATASNSHAPRPGFSSNRFSTNLPGSSRFSPFSSFSSGRSITNFGGSRLGSSGFGRSGFSNSLIGSNVSLIPSLLLGGLLRLGTMGFGGADILGGSALSFAARSFGFGLGSNGFSQGGFAGGHFGFGRGGLGWGFGFDEAPGWPACGAGASFWRPGLAWSGYCGPHPYSPLGWNGIGYFGDPRNGCNVTNDSSRDSELNQ
jgi:hypothetical protein